MNADGHEPTDIAGYVFESMLSLNKKTHRTFDFMRRILWGQTRVVDLKLKLVWVAFSFIGKLDGKINIFIRDKRFRYQSETLI